MLRKKETFTTITPIPGFIPRQLAIDILHSHSEVITLNPLVIDHYPIAAPRHAAADEYYSTWYEIVERIQYLPGIGKIGSGKLTFNGCFHDMPWGLQTHTHIPAGVEMRICYRVCGNQPGIEPPEHREIGLEELGVPKEGLYLREDIEIKCNFAMVSYIKSQLKAASKDMVARIIKKAELLDAGVLQGMMENGRLKTINPNDRSKQPMYGHPMGGQPSPGRTSTFYSQAGQSPTYANFPRPGTGSSQGYPSPNPQWQSAGVPPPIPGKEGFYVSELPGDMGQPMTQQVSQQQQPSPGLQTPYPYSNPSLSPGMAPAPLYHRDSRQSYDSRWSQQQYHPQPPLSPSFGDPHRTSMSSVASSNASHGAQNPSTFAAELAAHHETAEEHHPAANRA
jgi:hypothetical protein